MDIETMKKLIKKYEAGHADFVMRASVAERYYRNETDILFKGKAEDEMEKDNPLRNADNRIPRNFHGLIVNQKAAYAFTAPPLFDVGNTVSNRRISQVLGDEYAKNCMELCINAANTSIGWVHYWYDDNNSFEWAVVPSDQIIPIYDRGLKRRLIGVMRVYPDIDDDTGDNYTVYEYWSDTQCQSFRRRTSDTLDMLVYYDMFIEPVTSDMTADYKHEYGEVPFIPFYNNNIHMDDLRNIKPLIDVYDKVYSGFINDLDDIHELIFVLSGYGGEDLNTFLNDLKRYKTIKVDGDEGGAVSTLNIEIPIEARKSILEATRKAIFEQGQGFDPQPENFGNQSGEALKFMYSLLEMKTGLMETEFRLGFSRLLRAICKNQGIECGNITQTWTRTSIKNDTEQAEICKNSVGIVSKKTILKNHPLVEDADQELKQIDEEEKEAQKKAELYMGAYNNPSGDKAADEEAGGDES